jgi:hypothetical protein
MFLVVSLYISNCQNFSTNSMDPLEFVYDFIRLLTFSILYATTPDDGFELAETCSDIRV